MLLASALANVGSRFNMLSILVLPGLLMVQAIYVLLALAAVRLLRPGWRWLVLVAAVAVPALGIYGTVHPFPTGPLKWGVWLTLIGIGLCVLWFTYLQIRRPAPGAEIEVPGIVEGAEI
jgi:hypothetical protein